MMKNRLTEMLGIKYPIIQGGMIEISLSKLVAAVSNAGGLGTLGFRGDQPLWRDEIKKIKDLTDKPFAINLGMYLNDLKERIDIIIKEGVKIVVTSAGNPSKVINFFKDAGIITMHVISNSNQAKKIEDAGVDAIIAEGGESGGIVSNNIISTLVLVPKVVDCVSIPVIAAGGIGDARGFIACLAMGAEGVQMGTLFEASVESSASQEWKEGIIKANEMDTIVKENGPMYVRVIKEEIYPGSVITGQVAGLVARIEKSEDIINRMMSTIEPVMKKINNQLC
ncbi:MAG: hypothetical protein A2W19_13310 [Spirochaetes bacterium RBG_16_49_21]|nr:MAG: hypothetical protein A2W19_13310 [Spirochaetes bacterium RBG_16_49_21]